VDLTSLAYRTDIALRRLGGAQVVDRGDYVVVRSPDNPHFWWGNFLVLPEAPPPSDVDGWLARFAAEFPDAGHVALGFDGTDGRIEDLAEFARRGFTADASSVLTATDVREPLHPNRDADVRRLATDDDWAQAVELPLRCHDDGSGPDLQRAFTTARFVGIRRLVEAGHGAWFGAFMDGLLVAQLGLVRAEPGLARYQLVETDPDFRRRGLAGTLVHRAARYGRDELGVRTLVMVADPDDVAIRIYRAVGFEDTETQLQVQRSPGR
jgi:ribosomal protein S18 acetylase RimI-like enzyme